MSNLISPHGGGELRPLLLDEEARREELQRAKGLKMLPMTSRETGDLIMMGIGGVHAVGRAHGPRGLAWLLRNLHHADAQ